MTRQRYCVRRVNEPRRRCAMPLRLICRERAARGVDGADGCSLVLNVHAAPLGRRHADADASFTLTAPRRYEYETVDVTADVQAWAEKSEPNNGWVFENDVEDGWSFYNPMRHGNWATRLTITTSAGTAVVDELDILLTEGRMAPESKAIIAEALNADGATVEVGAPLQVHQRRALTDPQFGDAMLLLLAAHGIHQIHKIGH